MAKDSAIEWTHHTFNPWWGCTKVSPGCKHCYAETWARRIGQTLWGPRAPRRQLSDAYWQQPLSWNAEAQRIGKRRRVFCASMADVFEDRRDLDANRERLWRLIADTPNLDWLLLTKRPHKVRELAPYGDDWPNNVWLGATAENQKWLDRRMAELSELKAKILFLSCEPLLGPLDFANWIAEAQSGRRRLVHWVIAGGESGHHARAPNPQWFRSIRDQCVAAGIKFHFKQWGNWRPILPRQVNGYKSKALFLSTGEKIIVANVGKKKAGRRLDGRTWDEFPALGS
ncbi:MAG TPA: phage Gp37/Gp68 family protein [Burkholderiales bacterium]